MNYIVVHKIELKPNNVQATYFAKASGVARFAYNWALSKWQEQYKLGEKPSEAKLRKLLNSIKKTQYPWMLEVTKVAPQQAIKNLGVAFNRFFKKQSEYPKYKKKGGDDSFRADNGPVSQGANAVEMIDKKIKIPKLGWVRCKERLRYEGQIKSVTICKEGSAWYAAISICTDKLHHIRKNHAMVGVDLGVKTLATLSDGTEITGPKPYIKLLQRLRRLSKSLSRKQKNSNNAKKS